MATNRGLCDDLDQALDLYGLAVLTRTKTAGLHSRLEGLLLEAKDAREEIQSQRRRRNGEGEGCGSLMCTSGLIWRRRRVAGAAYGCYC